MSRLRRSAFPAAAAALLFACIHPQRSAAPAREATPPPPPPIAPADSARLWSDARDVFERRCVVCHGCYDAPCQLKLGTYEGVTRGASHDKVYDASRLVAAEPTRLDIDARDVDGWRKKGFHDVVASVSDPRASLLVRMLDLKRQHPLASTTAIDKDFTLDLDRKETCAEAKDFDAYAKDHPMWGMPYALPKIAEDEERALTGWVSAGAPKPPPEALSEEAQRAIPEYEAFLNEPSPRGQLVGRYVYEHLFLASLYFAKSDATRFYRLVRSRTPEGDVDEIPTRRPFDDPGVPRVYYRFVRRTEKPLDKTHMPYALPPARLQRWKALFVEPKYEVTALPSYAPEVAANPFRAFEALPAESRYRFMLDEAEYTMMGFIKGPVCRGQVALDVIEDRFFIAFLRPDLPWMKEEAAFLASEKQDLDMPAEGGSTALPTLWLRYGSQHARYVAKRNALMERVTKDGEGVTPRLIWDGDGDNDNATLTVFRHFDSATVVKGFVGRPTKTAWVVGYPLLERIHYLLVAGFDVFGNVGHQVTTRLYMDYLRMEGEADFLMFLPPARRKQLTELWYRGVTGGAKKEVERELEAFTGAPAIAYKSPMPEREMYAAIEARAARVMPHGYALSSHGDARVRAAMVALDGIRGKAAALFPEASFVVVTSPSGATPFTVLRDSAHTNVAHLFREDARRVPAEDELTVVHGFLGAYPNALFEVAEADLAAFVEAARALTDDASYAALRRRFGVLRTSDGFWAFSDRLAAEHFRRDGIHAGLFDYNRLQGL